MALRRVSAVIGPSGTLVPTSRPAVCEASQAMTMDRSPEVTSARSNAERICSAPPAESIPTGASGYATLSTVSAIWTPVVFEDLAGEFTPLLSCDTPLELLIEQLACMGR